MEFSHHSSNPLEARSSDVTNTTYKRRLNRVKQNAEFFLKSSDELGQWPEQQVYHNHIKDVFHLHGMRAQADTTPTAGPSRPPPMFMDHDEDMQSDDPLSLSRSYVEEEPRTLDPRKEFGDNNNDEESFQFRKEESLVEEDDNDIHGTYEVEPSTVVRVQDGHDDMYEEPYDDDGGGEEDDGFEIPEGEDEEMREDRNDSRPHSRSTLSTLTTLTPRSSDRASQSPISSPESSRPSSPDEYETLSRRPQEDQDEIVREMQVLYKSVPELKGSYELVDRLGTGTFSSVYKAVDMNYAEWYNEPWQGHHPPDSSAYYQSSGPGYKGRGGRAARWKHANGDVNMDGDRVDGEEHVQGRVFVAIKRIYTTSGPDRIRNELSIMEESRSCRHASQIITAFRNEDQVVIVLPYQRNMDFREFYQDLHPEGIKCYFQCLFRALRDIHARGIIHRDVKPANFLYDPFTGVGTLCDFGLASRMEAPGQLGQCLHTPPTEEYPHGKNVSLSESDTMQIKHAQREARAKSQMPAEKVGYPEQDRRPVSKANRAGTRGFRAPEVLLKCGAQTGAIDVWSAGVILLFFLTGKFPIFQSNDDVEGLMEIAVIIGKKNIERVATLHGRTIATNVPDLDHEGITWQGFVEKLSPSILEPRKYDMRYYPHNSKHKDGRGSMLPSPLPPQSSSPTSLAESADSNAVELDLLNPDHQAINAQSDRHANPPSLDRHTREMRNAFSFLELVLHVESTKRAPPRKALYHKFLEEPGVPGDDAFVPHRFGEGVCGTLHFKDEDDVNCVKIMRKCMCMKTKKEILGEDVLDDDEDVIDLDSSDDEGDGDMGRWCGEHIEEIRELSAGEGVAIGREPCEFHRNLAYEGGGDFSRFPIN